jgi:prophage DNA circulation protein
MSYLDDLRECTYTSPSGKAFTLQFDEVSRTGGKKLAVHDLPQQDRAEAQDLGNQAKRFPMTLYISGMDYHKTADDFDLALGEHYDGDTPGVLGHPRWGDILVVPSDQWTQTENFVDGMGQAVFSVEFLTVTRDKKFPTSSTDAAGALRSASSAAAASSASAYTDNGAPATIGEVTAVTATLGNLFTAIGDSLRGIASSAEDIGAQFDADLATAIGSVDALVSAPADLADALLTLARKPAEAVVAIADKVSQYRTMIDSMAGNLAGSYAEAEIVLMGVTAGCIGATDATLSGDLSTRADAVDASEDIDAIMAAFNALLEAQNTALGWLPDPQTVADMMEILSTCRARLLEASFSLKVERHYTVPGPVDPISLIKMLTGTFSDDALDQAVTT